MNDKDMKQAMLRQIQIWLPISLAVILYFVVVALVEMPIQKNSILYAKYGTSKPNQIN